MSHGVDQLEGPLEAVHHQGSLTPVKLVLCNQSSELAQAPHIPLRRCHSVESTPALSNTAMLS